MTNGARSPAARLASAAAPSTIDSSGTEDCGLLREQRYPDPVALVRGYVRSDTGADYGDLARYACPDEPPGSDESRVLTRLGLAPLSVGADSARVLVPTRQHGWMRWDSSGVVKRFVSEPATFVDTFVVLRTEYGWRFTEPGPSIDETPSAALARYSSLDDASRDSLRHLAAEWRRAEGGEGLLLTPTSLGGVPLCAPLALVRARFPAARDTTIESEGESWPGRVVPRADGSRLLFESSWTDTTSVWRASTDSREVEGPGGLRVGAAVADVVAAGEPATVSEPEGILVITFARRGVAAEVDDSSAAAFFRRDSGSVPADDRAPEPRLDGLPRAARLRALVIAGACS